MDRNYYTAGKGRRHQAASSHRAFAPRKLYKRTRTQAFPCFQRAMKLIENMGRPRYEVAHNVEKHGKAWVRHLRVGLARELD